MSKSFTFLRIAVILACFAIAVGAQTDWKGSYYFGEEGGKNASGIAIMISHELNVIEGDEGLAATLESNGFQTSSNLICTAKVEGPKLLIYFLSYGDNNMFEPYKEGDLLFTLERKPSGKDKPVILTNWGKFTPSIPKNEKSGRVYFERTDAVEPK